MEKSKVIAEYKTDQRISTSSKHTQVKKNSKTVEPVTNSATDYSSYDGGMSMKTAERNSSLGQGFPSAKLEFQLLTRGIVLNKL